MSLGRNVSHTGRGLRAHPQFSLSPVHLSSLLVSDRALGKGSKAACFSVSISEGMRGVGEREEQLHLFS